MRIYSRTTQAIGLIAAFAILSWAPSSRAQTIGATPVIPDNATALEGLPTARLDATREGAKRQRLDRDQATNQALQIKIVDGRYYWTSRENRPLTLTTSGEFIYLTSTEPGQYVSFRKINERLSYVEHVDMGLGSVTYWGELRIVLGK
jgi:hypothetical protein